MWLAAAAAADTLVGSPRWLPPPANASPFVPSPHVGDVVAVFVVALVVGVIEQLLAFSAAFSCLIIPGGTVGAEVDPAHEALAVRGLTAAALTEVMVRTHIAVQGGHALRVATRRFVAVLACPERGSEISTDDAILEGLLTD